MPAPFQLDEKSPSEDRRPKPGKLHQSRSMQKNNESPLPIKGSMSNMNPVSPRLNSQYGQGANSVLSGEDLRNIRVHSRQGDPFELSHLGSAASLPQAQSTTN